MRELPERKPTRLKEYDYSQNGAYFITICTRDRAQLFGDVGADSISARMVDDVFHKTIAQYRNVNCPKYVVMPNHFHAIIVIERADMESAPTVSEIVQAFKRYTTIEYIKLVKRGLLPPFEKQIWQRSYYDHVIRNDEDYREIGRYIDENPVKWEQDQFYPGAVKEEPAKS